MTTILRSVSLIALLFPAHMVLAQDYPVPYLTGDGKYQYVDAATLQPVFPGTFDMAQPFRSGIALAETRGHQHQYLLPSGQPAMNITFDEGNSFRGDRAVIYRNGLSELINKRGETIQPRENVQEWTIAEGRAVIVDKAGKAGYIDVESGLQTVAVVYEAARAYSEGLAAVRQNNKWGFIDKSGKNIVPAIYDDVTAFSEGLAGVRVNNKWGAIDMNGRMVISPRFEKITSFSGGHAFVQITNGSWGIIDRTGNAGNVRLPFQAIYPLSEGLAGFMHDNLWGFVDAGGKIIIQPSYLRASSFVDGVAMVIKGNQRFYIDKQGREFRNK